MKPHVNVLWLRRVINHIQVSCDIKPIVSLTIIYEDNVARVAYMCNTPCL
jgi:hypothetical protein